MTNDLLVPINKKTICIEIGNLQLITKSMKINKKYFKTYDRIVSDGIQNAKYQYYFNTFVSHKNDMKKTWKTIDETLNRGNNKTNFPSEFIVDHKLKSDHKEIADNFNVFFANIEAKLSAGNNQSNCSQSYSDYLNNPTPHRFTLQLLMSRTFYPLSTN